MFKGVKVVALTVGLVIAGAGVAEATNTGTFSVSTDGSYVSNGTYNFYGYQVIPGVWYPNVAGTFVVTTATDHLNAKPDGYSYAKLVQANSNGSYGFNRNLSQGGTGGSTVASTINVQVCREHWYGDDCHSVTKTR